MVLAEISPFVRFARLYTPGAEGVSPRVCQDARLFFTQEGAGEIRAEKTVFRMGKNALLLLPPGTEYAFGPDGRATYLVLNFDYTRAAMAQSTPVPPLAPEDYAPSARLDPVGFEDAPAFSRPLYFSFFPGAADGLSRVLTEYTLSMERHAEAGGAYLAALLFELDRRCRLGASGGARSMIADLLSYIGENCHRPLTNGELGRRFGFHPNYIARVVRTATGMPLHRYVCEVRVRRAAALLLESRLSVSEVAAACGFCDVYYFSRIFRKMMGCPPGAYRRGAPLAGEREKTLRE